FFQAEDGIRAFHVTGVQTCALPIFRYPAEAGSEDAVMEAAIEAGAQDVESDLAKPDIYEDAPGHTIWTDFEDLNEVAEAMSRAQIGRASCRERAWGGGGGRGNRWLP